MTALPTESDVPRAALSLFALLFCGQWYQGFSQLSRLNFQIIFNSLLCPISICSHVPDPGGVLPLISSLLSSYRRPCSVLDIIYSFSKCLQSTCSVPCMETRLGSLGPGETWSVATWLTAWWWRQAHEQISISRCDRVALME